MKLLIVFLPSLDGMLVHRRVTSRHKICQCPYTPNWIYRYCESKMSRPITQHNEPCHSFNTDSLISSLEWQILSQSCTTNTNSGDYTGSMARMWLRCLEVRKTVTQETLAYARPIFRLSHPDYRTLHFYYDYIVLHVGANPLVTLARDLFRGKS